MKFTQAEIRKTAAEATTDTFYWHPDVKGFGVRVRKGSGHYVVQYRVGTKQRRKSLGNVHKRGLEDVLKQVRGLFNEVAHDRDPVVAAKKAKLSASKTFEVLVEEFLVWQADKIEAQWLQASRRALMVHCRPLHGMAVSEIDRLTVASCLKKMIGVCGKHGTDRNRSALSKFFTWAMGEGHPIQYNPVDGTNRAAGEYKPRQRVLTAAELKHIWAVLERSDRTFVPIVKLLALTAQRKTEIADLKWSEIDFDAALIRLDSSRVKNGEAHEVPLSNAAVTILKSLPRLAGHDFVFSKRGTPKRGFSGWTKAKRDIDAQLKLPHWTFHDLRRTGSTMMHELGVEPHIVEEVVNHQSGHKGGISGVYNWARYRQQKREALTKLANHILEIVGPTPPKLSLVA